MGAFDDAVRASEQRLDRLIESLEAGTLTQSDVDRFSTLVAFDTARIGAAFTREMIERERAADDELFAAAGLSPPESEEA